MIVGTAPVWQGVVGNTARKTRIIAAARRKQMRTFDRFNTSGAPCPICGTHAAKPPVLIPIHGTEDDGICEALQVHLDCINLTAYRENGKIILGMAAEEIKERAVQPTTKPSHNTASTPVYSREMVLEMMGNGLNCPCCGSMAQ